MKFTPSHPLYNIPGDPMIEAEKERLISYGNAPEEVEALFELREKNRQKETYTKMRIISPVREKFENIFKQSQ